MLTRHVLLAAALLLVPLSAPMAQQQPQNYNRLKDLLEKKFAPGDQPSATRSLTDDDKSDRNEKKDKQKFQWIKPKDSATPGKTGMLPFAGMQADASGGAGADTLWNSVYAYLRKKVGSSLAATVGDDDTLAADTTKVRVRPEKPAPADKPATAPPAAGAEVAQANTPPQVPVAKKNSYVIQLKSDAKEEDIAALLKKYNLTVTKVIGDLGVITVEIADQPPEPSADGDATRGLAPSGEPQAETSLGKILQPRIIKQLRAEPIVDAAIVNSTIGTKVLPKPAGASVQSRGKSYAWRWTPGEAVDGNWALKTLRMPPVWTILDRHRKRNPAEARPKVGIIDAGFAENPDVPFHSMVGVQKFTVLRPDCATHHAMHVSGIIGARQGSKPGIDGMIPDARIDAVAISNQGTNEAEELGVEELWQLQTLLFDEVLGKTMDYIIDNVTQPDNLRVINISLGYNFLAKKLIDSADLDDVEGLKLHIHHQASIIKSMARRVENQVLFVVAAGNDSEDRAEPLPARWASPFAWAATYEGTGEVPSPNILVVEASDRTGARAEFSNAGGLVSAPGVDIMSTLASGSAEFGVCSGTSQAAPFVSSLAAILFELDPTKKPVEVIKIIKSTATPPPAGSTAAPEVDALEAVLQLPGTKALLADLNDDGKVDSADLVLFKGKLDAIREAAATEAAFSEDLNADGVVDDNECFWPLIDFNGSGSGATQPADFKRLGGLFRSDLNVLALAWSDTPDTYEVALTQSGLDPSVATDTLTASIEEAAAKPCRRKDGGAGGSTVVAANETPPAGTTTPVAGGPTEPSGVTAAAATDAGTPTSTGESATPAPAATSGTTEAAEETRGLAPSPVVANADSPEESKAQVEEAVNNLRKLNPRLRITINPATGLPSSITGFLPRPGAGEALGSSARGGSGGEQTEEETQRAVEGFFATSGLTAAFPTTNRNVRNEYLGRRRDPDFPDRYIATIEQRVGDIPVFGSSAKLTVEGLAGVTKYVGTPSQVNITDTNPQVSEADAIAAARERLAEVIKPTAEDPAPQIDPDIVNKDAKTQLIIYDPALIEKNNTKPTRLAWLVEIDSFRLFVDAKSKEVFHYYRDRPTGALRRIFDLDQGKTFPGKSILDETLAHRDDDLPPDGSLAYQNTGDVRDFFFMVFGRDGFDDNDGPGPNGGSPIESYIRYASVKDAFWCPFKSAECPKPDVMVFGPGYAGSIDIVGHEMTHGIIAHEKNLLYLNEPGAVNESLADIFGTLIELHQTVPYGNWVIGENAPGFSVASPLRSLADPNLRDADGNALFDRKKRYAMANRGQPDNYEEVLTTTDTLCGSTRYQDNGCVHFNSGILNKMAYLISEGGAQRGVTVQGIGRFKLARIAYRTMTAQLNESSGLIEAADGFALSCLELAETRVGGISSADCEQVFAAQQAVGLIYSSS